MSRHFDFLYSIGHKNVLKAVKKYENKNPCNYSCPYVVIKVNVRPPQNWDEYKNK